MSSFLFHNTIIPIQVTLLGVRASSPGAHMTYNKQTIIPIQLTFLAVKVLGMLQAQHTNPLSLNWSWYWEIYLV